MALISSDKYQKAIEESSRNIGIGLDSLVSEYNKIDTSVNLPTNIGGAIGQLVAMSGSQYIKSK